MKVEVKLFAVARQLAGKSTLTLQLPPGATAGDLRRAMAEACPELSDIIQSMAIAVNHEYVPDEAAIDPGAEIACIPPVSGG